MNRAKAFLALAFFLGSPVLGIAGQEPVNTQSAQEALEKNLPDFVRIDENIYRGSQPKEEDLKRLKELGVRTLVNFRTEKKWVEWERKKAEELGFEYIHLPWRIYLPAKKEIAAKFLEAAQKKDRSPVFFHCKRGVERTGVADAVYRYYFQKLPEQEAFEKAMNGHKRLLRYRIFLKPRYYGFIEKLGPQDSFPKKDPS